MDFRRLKSLFAIDSGILVHAEQQGIIALGFICVKRRGFSAGFDGQIEQSPCFDPQLS